LVADGHEDERVAEGVIKVDAVLPEHVDIDVLGVLGRRGRPLLAVGAIDPVQIGRLRPAQNGKKEQGREQRSFHG
jgi:hypothetical protein